MFKIKGPSVKKRFVLLFEALLIAAAAWAILSIPSDVLTLVGIGAWCVVGMLLLCVVGAYCVYKHRHWLCVAVALLLIAGTACADIADIHVVPIKNKRGIETDQCRVTATANPASAGESMVTQEQLDAWMKKPHWSYDDYAIGQFAGGLKELFKSFPCDKCAKLEVIIRESGENEHRKHESIIYAVRYLSEIKARIETKAKRPLSDGLKEQLFLAEAQLAFYEHCAMYVEWLKDCPKPKEYVEENQKDCYACMLVGLAITAVDLTASIFEQYISSNMMVVFGLCFCLWLMWMVARCLIGVDDGVTFVQSVFVKALWFVCMALLLAQPLSWVLETLTVPFAQLAGWVSEKVSDASSFGSATQSFDSETGRQKTSPIATGTVSMPNYCSSEETWDDSKYTQYIPGLQSSGGTYTSVLPPAVKNAVICPVYNNFKVVITSLAIGQSLQCRARTNTGACHWYTPTLCGESTGHIFPDFELWVAGATITLSSYFVAFLLPFFMIEVVLRMALFFVPFPLWCLALMYKPTRGFATRAFIVFLHALLCLVTLSVAAAFIMESFNTVIAPNKEAAQTIVQVLNDPEGNTDPLKELFTVTGSCKMVVMFFVLSWFSYKILSLSVGFADKILGASMGSAAAAFGEGIHKSVIAVRDALRKAAMDMIKQ